ncbi:hypothetical protein DL93DRAFT_2095570 [Clavulina sp. PMI_390]|nr:hypothetical protein DL93DRAFT_2095570 [Clavulina sp. PMI_390]
MTGPATPDLDLLPRIKGMYRLLELVSEQGSGGVIDKIVISQEPLRQLLEQFYPGAYPSLTTIILQPIGIYGSIQALVEFLVNLGAIDAEVGIMNREHLLLASADGIKRPQPSLQTGIYFLLDLDQPDSKRRKGHVIYWPEHTTWDDNAPQTIKHSRVIFMRYLTKLVDQIIGVISKKHSDAIVWGEEMGKTSREKVVAHGRLYSYKIQGPKEQDESVAIDEGFKAHLTPRIIAGEVRQGIIAGSNRPSQNQDLPQVTYTVYPISLNPEDVQAFDRHAAHVPKPVVRATSRWSFSLPVTQVLRYIQMFGNGECLLIVDVMETGNVNVFLEEDNHMATAITRQHAKIQLYTSELGEDYILSVDESKHRLVLCSGFNNRLYVYTINERSLKIQHSTDFDLNRCLTSEGGNKISISSIACLSGSDELVVTAGNGHAKIFSLITEQMRPASVILPFVPNATHSAPDGSCIFFLYADEEKNLTDIRVYHSASFGTNQGSSFSRPSLAWAQGCLTSFGSRSNAYLVAWSMETTQFASVRFEIKNRVNPFSFEAQNRQEHNNEGFKAQNRCNSLIDIHSEVWTRFPVASTVVRSSPAAQREPPLLQFATNHPDKPFVAYFTKLVHRFEKSSQKPTQGKLERLKVEAVSFSSLNTKGHRFKVTSYPAGKWLVELLCLIPIHLAIASGNRFIPLANGVNSAEYERSLLGADVIQIANSISLGWYESIFASYMATKPVKVVSSITLGEQSVDKSYALNHFVDTSFTGSAMRCAEGVWLSVTPTEEGLIVALNLEGMQWWPSFETASCRVIGSPSILADIFTRILQKFKRLVNEEGERNFISKLHRGMLDIIPWPALGSKEFYDLMDVLKARLNNQKPSHGNASMFLQALKILMAQLKASDWGPLDVIERILKIETLASSRALALQKMLASALSYGVTYADSPDSQLKNLDTNEAIGYEDSNCVFWLKDEGNPSTRRDTLLKLRESWPCDLERHYATEARYIVNLAEYLQHLAAARVLHVGAWIDCNVSGFPSEHPDIRALKQQFSMLSTEQHNCGTTHHCPHQSSGYNAQQCGLAAGHAGNHIYQVRTYLCGMPCYLNGRLGCQGICTQNFMARQFVLFDVALTAHTSDSRREHEKHLCENRLTCPIQCQLCTRQCSVASHDHASENNAVHLCGLYHDGPHMHTLKPDIIHLCNVRCPFCDYFCTLAFGHAKEHSTSHGVAAQTHWSFAGDATIGANQRRIRTDTFNSPYLCSTICKELGHHAHISYCRASDSHRCVDEGMEHINSNVNPEPHRAKDWITHKTFWSRSGFKDPYTAEEQGEFAKCDSECSGTEHRASEHTVAAPSYCTLPMFHAPVAVEPQNGGHLSKDGHIFKCRKPSS